jgi:hypothetical protein
VTEALATTELRRVTFEIPGGRMAGIAFGAEKPTPDIVFLHATGFNAHTYRALLAQRLEQGAFPCWRSMRAAMG